MRTGKTLVSNWLFATVFVLSGWLMTAPTLAKAQNCSQGGTSLATCQGWNGVYLSGSSKSPSYAFVDAFPYLTDSRCASGSCDICDAIYYALTDYNTANSNGVVIDARGIATPQNCTNVTGSRFANPWSVISARASYANIVLLPTGSIYLAKSWVLPTDTRIIGEGASLTTILPCTTTVCGSGQALSGDLIDMGSSSICPGSSDCQAVVIEHLGLNGSNVSGVNGIVNSASQELSRVDDVSLVNIAGTGLSIDSGNTSNSGPYSNIYYSGSGICASVRPGHMEHEGFMGSFAACAGCLAASLINPYFYHLHQHLLEYFRDPFTARYIMEFQSVNFQSPGSDFFEYLLALGFGAGIWFALKKRFGDLILLLAWAHVALPSVRHVPIYAIVAAPVVAAAVVEWLNALSVAPVAGWIRACADLIRSAGADIEPFEHIGRTHVVGLVFLAAIALGMRSPSAGKLLKPEYDPKAYPSKALALLGDPNARIFAPDEWGDYLVYNLWPKGGKVFVDGRSDFYGHDFFEQYISLLNVKYDWEQTLRLYQVNTILLPPDAFLATTVKESKNWRVVYDDGSAIVFVPSRPLNAAGEQFSTQSSCGIGRDLSIAHQSTVISDRVTKKGA